MRQTVIESLSSPVRRICCIGAGYVSNLLVYSLRFE